MTFSLMYGPRPIVVSEPISEMSVQSSAIDFVMQWRRCGMTADYLADFLAYAFEQRDAARSVVSTVANELIENAVKFSSDKSRLIQLSVRNFGSALQLEAVNYASAEQVASFRKTLTTLCQGDPARLFVAQMERAAATAQAGSGVGLILLCRDYGAQLGVNAEPDTQPATFRVSVQVTLRAQEIEQA